MSGWIDEIEIVFQRVWSGWKLLDTISEKREPGKKRVLEICIGFPLAVVKGVCRMCVCTVKLHESGQGLTGEL